MLMSTLCYLERGEEYLMLHRVKKKNDANHDKWIGVGGKFEEGESPEECILRETREETGLTLTSWRCRGVVTFLTNGPWDGEYMYLFTADGFEGELKECDEGDLRWVSREFLDALPKWEGDKIFLDLLWQDAPFFLLKLRYDGDRLVQADQMTNQRTAEAVRFLWIRKKSGNAKKILNPAKGLPNAICAIIGAKGW